MKHHKINICLVYGELTVRLTRFIHRVSGSGGGVNNEPHLTWFHILLFRNIYDDQQTMEHCKTNIPASNNTFYRENVQLQHIFVMR
jgi:hypothetical protein